MTKRDVSNCYACDVICRPEIHHIVPRAAGGSNEKNNTVPLCTACHNMVHGIGSNTYEMWEFVAKTMPELTRNGKLLIMRMFYFAMLSK